MRDTVKKQLYKNPDVHIYIPNDQNRGYSDKVKFL